ncbi:MAG: orotate phosphoribosyltransferase [Gammaproteobacteria bacterium AqS3]|nr:orotate phosphoribosyltransferase [Gammaproteobacteria bacterium AqS3]
MRRSFIKSLIEKEALIFGDFKLKSGRKSPYFFNIGNLSQGSFVNVLGRQYAESIQNEFGSQSEGDTVLFGPAYKGIPLVTATAMVLGWEMAYDRKEEKEHGEGGRLCGSDLDGREVILIDDVLTAGTAVRHSAELIEEAGGKLKGVVLAFDRQEKVDKHSGFSATQKLQEDLDVAVESLACMDDLLDYLLNTSEGEEALPDQQVKRMLRYRERYGVRAA